MHRDPCPPRPRRGRALALLAVGTLLALAGCGSDDAAPMTDDDGIRGELLASTDEMMGWITSVVGQGVRRPGYEADDRTTTWAAERFREAGLENVRLEPITVQRWEPRDWSLTLSRPGRPNERLSLPCYPLPFSAETTGVRGELALSAGTASPHLSGKIAVFENNFLTLPQHLIRTLFGWPYDPQNEFDTLVQTLPFSDRFSDAMGPEIEAGAIGFIGILRLPFETDKYYVPYNGLEQPIPGVWVSSANGDTLLQYLNAGTAQAEIVLERSLTPRTSYNVVGELPGASDEWIIIGSHHDAPWASAVEDASGIAMVLAQAQYWAQVPRAQRPHNLLFLLNGGHMSGGAGLLDFVDTHARFVQDEVVAEIHLEHAARETRGENGQLVVTDEPEVRWWFTSFIPALENAVFQALCAEDLRRSFIMPVEGFPPGSLHPPTDGAFFHPQAPVVNFLTAPMYLFDQQDTLDKIHEDSLVPVTRAAIRIINALREETARSLRDSVYPAPRREIPPCASDS